MVHTSPWLREMSRLLSGAKFWWRKALRDAMFGVTQGFAWRMVRFWVAQRF
jgi:hypothetical protein